jgi:hypothetical protein
MRPSDGAVSQWLEKNQPAMIHCPFQPGRLVISRDACKKRHLASHLEPFEETMETDFFKYTFRKGLSLCNQCPIGMRLAGPSLAAKGHRDWEEHQESGAAVG